MQFPILTTVALSPVLAVVAGAYATVGLGGGSGYVAVMVLFGLPAAQVAPTALLLNFVVTGAALFRYGLAGRLRMGCLLPFLLPALPAAVLGGSCSLPGGAVLYVLSAALVVAAVGTLRSAGSAGEGLRQPSLSARLLVGIPCGAAIGFISGLVGIGGGVFLGPVVLLLRWASAKEVAALNAVTVMCLSGAGLVGHGLRGPLSISIVVPFVIAVLIGGMIGAHLGEKRLAPSTLRTVLGVLVLIAGIKAAVDAMTG